jgi:hypothetical protein
LNHRLKNLPANAAKDTLRIQLATYTLQASMAFKASHRSKTHPTTAGLAFL